MSKKEGKSMRGKKNILEIFLLVSYGIYFLYLYFSNKINFFVHPDYAFLALCSGIFLIVFAILYLIRNFQLNRRIKQVNCDSNNYLASNFNLILLILPLFLALIFDPKPLSSAIATTRNTGFYADAALSRENIVFSGFIIDSKKRSLVDWVRLFTQDPEPDHYKDLKAKLIGFVLKDSNLPSDYFMLSRFVISCCAADARPIGIPVKYDPSKIKLDNDQWIEIEGHFESNEIDGQRQPVLVLDNLKPVDIPKNPYAT